MADPIDGRLRCGELADSPHRSPFFGPIPERWVDPRPLARSRVAPAPTVVRLEARLSDRVAGPPRP